VSVSNATGNGTITATVSGAGLLNGGGYSLTVTNPNAGPSNPLSFNVTPGVPHLTSLDRTSAPQQDTPVTVNVVGSNFAMPDTLDNGGSSIHLFSASVSDYRIPSLHDDPATGPTCTSAKAPCARVIDASHMTAYVDTRAGVPGAYSVQIWNPGSANPPQKSPETLTFTIN
jgi:hypothetical protein